MQTKEEEWRGMLYANQRATCSWLWPFHSKPLSAAPTVPCAAAAAIPGCMIPPAIPIISGYFIISGCSHNSDLNGVVCAGPPVGGTEKKCDRFKTMSHPHYLVDLPAQQSLLVPSPRHHKSMEPPPYTVEMTVGIILGVPSSPPLVAH